LKQLAARPIPWLNNRAIATASSRAEEIVTPKFPSGDSFSPLVLRAPVPGYVSGVETATMPLTATADPGHHQIATDVIYFYMSNGDQRVRCGVSRLALELLEPDLPPTKEGRVQAFNQRRARIERIASAKFDRGQFEPDGRTILVRVVDLV
jgi:Protein of unknown function (DUF1488)